MTTANPLTRFTHTLRERLGALPPGAVRAAWLAAVVLAGVVSWAAFASWASGDALRDRAEEVAALLKVDSAPDAADPKDADADPGRRGQGRQRGQRGGGSQVAAVKRVAERRFFSPAPPQGFRNARGVLGDRVLYAGGQSFAVGDNVMGATVKEIGLNHVELEYEGETVRVEFGSGGGSSARPSRRGGRRFRRSR